jgi:hypothetical protein
MFWHEASVEVETDDKLPSTWKRNRRRLALQRDLRPLVHELGYLKHEVEDLESATRRRWRTSGAT